MSCRTPFENRYPLNENGECRLCRAGLRGFDAAYSFTAYEGNIRELIHLLKYGRMKPLAGPLGAMMMAALPRGLRIDLIAPMPLHWLRRWQRGFNQSALLAGEISRRTGIPVSRLAVRRTRRTAAQAGLSNAKRRDNVAGAFRASRRVVEGRRVLLVDDVMTTGATATACALAIKRSGAQRVELITLARADRRLMPGPLTSEAS